MLPNLDCRHLRGDKPCRFGTLCENCSHYEPMGVRILVVKLDAIGDVARTTPLLRPLREKYAPCHVTWLVAAEAYGLLEGNPLIEVLLPYDAASLERLHVERFDLALSLDKTPRAAAVGTGVRALDRRGFGLSEFGTIFPFDAQAEYAYQLGIDDDLKFRQNQRTYQDVIFEVCGLAFQGEEYEVPLGEEERQFARAKSASWGLLPGEAAVGLNLGGGAMFAHKMWEARESLAFIAEARRRVKCKVVLFGAEREKAKVEEILSACPEGVVSAGLDNTLKQFQALVGQCDVLVGGDTLGMHLAIAEKTPQVVLFGPTCAQEIELYGRGEKVVSPLPCVPCYRKTCDHSPNCMEAIRPATVAEAVERLIRNQRS